MTPILGPTPEAVHRFHGRGAPLLQQHPDCPAIVGRGFPRRPSSPKGLSLVEVLVAIAFFAVVSVGLAGLAIGVINGNARSRELDIAVYLAHDWLETMRNTPYASITAAKFPEQGYGTITVGPDSFPDFKRSVAIQNNTPTTGMTRVVVTVTSRRGGSVSGEMVVGPWQQ